MAGPNPASIGPNAPAAQDDPRIRAALARLGECVSLPAFDQIEVFQDVHRRLAEVLSDPRAQA
jgi:hypothetical protein